MSKPKTPRAFNSLTFVISDAVFAYSWKLPAYSGAFFLQLIILVFTYSWSLLFTALFFTYSWSFWLTVGKCV